MSRRLRGGGALLVAIVLLAIALRFSTLGVQSFSDDELFTTWLMKMPLGHMLSTIPQTERTPYLFYIVEWLGTRVFGTGEVGMRVLPAAFGAAVVPVIYLAGALGASRRVGLAAALFAAVSPFLIWYSQEARAYSLLILLVAVSLLFLIAYARDGRTSSLAWWGIASAAAVATHYFALFVILPEVAWVALRTRRPASPRLWIAAVPIVTAAGLIPLMIDQSNAVGDRLEAGGRSIIERLVAIPKNFLVGFSIPAELALSVAAGALAVVGLWLALTATTGVERRLARQTGALAAFGLVLPLIVSLLGFDFLTSRNTMATMVPIALLLGCGFAVRRVGWAALAVLGAASIAIVIGVATDPSYQRRDWRSAAEALGPSREGRLLVFSPMFKNLGPFRVYYGNTTRTVTSLPLPRVREVASVALAQFSGFGPGADRPPPGPPPRPPAGFRLVEDVRTSTYRLVRFRASRPMSPSPLQVLSTSFARVPVTVVWQPGPER